MILRRFIPLALLPLWLSACSPVAIEAEPSVTASAKPVEREGYGDASDRALMQAALASGTISANSQFQEIAAQGFTSKNGKIMRLSKGVHNLIQALIYKGISIEVMSAGRPGHGQHGEPDPSREGEYFIAALDISKVNGKRIDVLHPEEALSAIEDLMKALPAGAYETGFPRKPYPIDDPAAACFAAHEAATYGSIPPTATLYAGAQLIQADRSAFSAFIDSSYNTPDIYDATKNPNGCRPSSYSHRKPFFAGMKNSEASRLAAIEAFVSQLGLIAPGVDAPDALAVRSRVRDAYLSALGNGAGIDMIYGDALNHFHLSIYHASETTDTRVFKIGDVNRDGRSDIFVRNYGAASSQRGQNFIWAMNGVQRSKIQTNSVDDLNWMMIGYGDFNGDGNTDAFWFNRQTGQKSIWLMQGHTVIGNQEPNGETGNDMNWVPAGVGDFNADGISEILWRNLADGTVGIWSWDGHSILEDSGLLAEAPGLDRYVGGVTDYDKDGISDIVWVHRQTGELTVLLMALEPAARLELYLDSLPDLSWSVRAAGDFKGDGTTGLMLHHSGDGQVALSSGYSMENFSSTEFAVNTEVGSLPATTWRIGGTLEP